MWKFSNWSFSKTINKTTADKQNTLDSATPVQSTLKDFAVVICKKDIEAITRASSIMQKVNSSTDSTITMFDSSQKIHKNVEDLR